ncbi:MAG: pyridoxal-phosphate dependent enzyme [Candidatus Methanomethylicia archaeon]
METILKCVECGKRYNYDIRLKLCENCGSGLTIEVKDLDMFEYYSDAKGLWKFSKILPEVNEEAKISLGEGNTHLHKGQRVGRELNVELWFKDETTEPTGSYLDRSSALFISKILSLGFKEVNVYSMGNLGASLSAYAARAGIKSRVYINFEIDVGKLYQMISYGSEVKVNKQSNGFKRIDGIYAIEYDPLINEAKKTIAWEIMLQMMEAPEYIILPMGEGGLAYHTYKALMEMERFNMIRKRRPRIIGVQPSGCAPIVKAFERGWNHIEVEESKTSIFDLNVPNPKYGKAALKAIRETRGLAVSIEESEARKALIELARNEGILTEPAASLTIAALKKLLNMREIEGGSRIVCVLTGSGLKDPRILREIAILSPEIGGIVKDFSGRYIGDTKLAIMKILLDREMYGYQIWKELKDKYGIRLRIPTLYQHLSELVGEGYIRKMKMEKILGRRREYYILTEKGKKLV